MQKYTKNTKIQIMSKIKKIHIMSRFEMVGDYKFSAAKETNSMFQLR